MSVTYGCIKFIDSYRFLSSSLDSLVKTLVDNKHITLGNLKKEIDGNGNNILNVVNEIETLINEDRTIEDIKKAFPVEIQKLEEALNSYISENDLKLLKTELPDQWNFFNK